MSQLIYPKDFTNIQSTTTTTTTPNAQTLIATHNGSVFLNWSPFYFLVPHIEMLIISDDQKCHAAVSIPRQDVDGPFNYSYTKDLTSTAIAWSVKLSNGQTHFIKTAKVAGTVSLNQHRASGTVTGKLEDNSDITIDFDAQVK